MNLTSASVAVAIGVILGALWVIISILIRQTQSLQRIEQSIQVMHPAPVSPPPEVIQREQVTTLIAERDALLAATTVLEAERDEWHKAAEAYTRCLDREIILRDERDAALAALNAMPQ